MDAQISKKLRLHSVRRGESGQVWQFSGDALINSRRGSKAAGALFVCYHMQHERVSIIDTGVILYSGDHSRK